MVAQRCCYRAITAPTASAQLSCLDAWLHLHMRMAGAQHKQSGLTLTLSKRA